MQTKTDIIKQILPEIFPSCTIFLFGSRAKNSYTINSDYHILIIIEDNLSISQKRENKAKIRKLLAQEKIAVDVIIQSKKEIEVKKNNNRTYCKTSFKRRC